MITSFEKFNESKKSAPSKYAVTFKVVLEDGDVDFNATKYDIKTAEDFFKDTSFMKKIKKIVSEYKESKFEKIDSVKKLVEFFKHAKENEYFSGGEFDAMTEKDYKKELKFFKENSDDDDY